MHKFKIFVGNDIYSIVEADAWTITSSGAANFLVAGEVVMTYDRGEWFFVELA